MSFIDNLSKKLYDKSTSGWFGQKMNDIVGDDYQKHLFNMTVGGGLPTFGYGQDYRDAENEGESGWGRVGQNAGRSAAILASIFGGSAAAGGGGASGGGAAGGAGGAAGGASGGGAGTGVGTGSGIGAENGGLMLDNGGTAAGAGGGGWAKLLSQGLGGMGGGMGGGGGGNASSRSQPVDFSQQAFAPVQPQAPQQGNSFYSPLAPNGMQSGLMTLGNPYGYG